MLLYHTGPVEIRRPDLHYGRKNADFAQGFYLTPSREFAERWGMEGSCINSYEFSADGLEVYRFTQDEAWVSYILANRAGREDTIRADVIIGPIANDTVYDTLGIMSSGFLTCSEVLSLLKIGPVYEQIVIKTEKAADQLRWLSSRRITPREAEANRLSITREEREYQRLLGQALEELT